MQQKMVLLVAAGALISSAPVATHAQISASWNVNDGGNWSESAKWSPQDYPRSGGIATFAGAISAPRSIGVNVDTTLSGITFDSINPYTLTNAGGAITLSNNGDMVVSGGTHTIAATIAGATLNKSGAGKLILSGDNSFLSANVSEGVLNIRSNNGLSSSSASTGVYFSGILELEGGVNIGSNNSLGLQTSPAMAPNGALRSVSGNNTWAGLVFLFASTSIGVDSGTLAFAGEFVDQQPGQAIITKVGAGTMIANRIGGAEISGPVGGLNIQQGTVQIAPNGTSSGVSEIHSLSIAGGPTAPTAKFDLTNNGLVLHYAAGLSPINDVRQYIRAGYNGGNWQGNGLTSSSAAAIPSNRSLGYSDSGSAVTVKYTVAGDANLDGSTDGSDLNIWNDNKFQSGKVWTQADSNYDGATDGSDLNIWNDNKFTMITGASAASVATNASGHIADMIYDPSSGQLKLVVHDVGVVQAAILVETAEGNVIAGHPGNLPNHPFGFQSWSYRYFNGKMQFTDDALNLGGGASVGTGEYVIGTLLTGLGLSDFGVVEYGSNLGTQFTTVSLIPEPATLGLIAAGAVGLLMRRRRA